MAPKKDTKGGAKDKGGSKGGKGASAGSTEEKGLYHTLINFGNILS